MAESFKYQQKRVVFHESSQEIFLLNVKNKTTLSETKLAALVGVHRRTFNGWARGEYLLPWSAAKILTDHSGILLPRDIEVRDRYWYTRVGARRGWLAVQKKYGKVPVNQEYRLKKWREWWNREGKHRADRVVGVCKAIKSPRFSVRLAEFVGLVMGDGGISKYQLIVTLDKVTDSQYSEYVASLIKELFDTPVARKSYGAKSRNHRVTALVVSRVELVRFCRDRLGLKVGNKLRQGLDVPNWIKGKREYEIACLRGLMDTDGCVFNECHHIKNRLYCYPRLCFVSASDKLCGSVFRIMESLQLFPVRRSDRKVQLENKQSIIDYFAIIGTNNPKHLRRFQEFTGGVEQLVALRS